MYKRVYCAAHGRGTGDLRSDNQEGNGQVGETAAGRYVLLKADADGPAWNDTKISEAVGCRRRKTVENVRQAFVLEGFEGAAGSQETGNAADAENAGRRCRGEVDRHAVG